jgi:hypothetical protein
MAPLSESAAAARHPAASRHPCRILKISPRSETKRPSPLAVAVGVGVGWPA